MKNLKRFLRWIILLTLLTGFASGINAQTPVVINAENAAQLVSEYVLEGHEGTIYALAWSPDGTTLASASQDGTVRLWDTATWQETAQLIGHDRPVWGVAWSPDGTQIASAGWNRDVLLWDVATSSLIRTLDGRGRLFDIEWSPDGLHVASGSANGSVFVWDAATGERVARLEGHLAETIAVIWSADGNSIISGSIDTTIRVWDWRTGAEIERLLDPGLVSGVRADVNGLALSPDGTRFASARQTGQIAIWDALSLEFVMRTDAAHIGWARGVVWSPDGVMLASTGDDERLIIRSADTGDLVARISGHEAPVWSIAWSPDGSQIATGSGQYDSDAGEHHIRIWTVPENE
jgi:WD40 repeat protein